MEPYAETMRLARETAALSYGMATSARVFLLMRNEESHAADMIGVATALLNRPAPELDLSWP